MFGDATLGELLPEPAATATTERTRAQAVPRLAYGSDGRQGQWTRRRRCVEKHCPDGVGGGGPLESAGPQGARRNGLLEGQMPKSTASNETGPELSYVHVCTYITYTCPLSLHARWRNAMKNQARPNSRRGATHGAARPRCRQVTLRGDEVGGRSVG